MNKYIKKPVKVEALQIHGNVSEIKEFIGENGDAYIYDGAWKAGAGQPRTAVIIHTLEGDMKATDGDYIIKGVKGEFYPCRKDIFEETYELAEGEQNTDWMYAPFNKDKIMAQKEQWTKEAEEADMTLTEYLESINPLRQDPCEDAISRADVKKYLSAPNKDGDRVIYESDLDLLPSVQPKIGRWIPVSERLPEDRREVLVTAYWHETYQVMIASYYGDDLWWCVPFNNCGEHMQRLKPKAWMSLPEPYKAESEVEKC